MNDNFYTISEYIDCKPDLLCKIKAINDLIAAFELKLLDVVGSAVYDEYQMDDGQMKVRTKYRSPEDVLKGLDALEKLKQRYVNRCNGRVNILRGNY